MQWGTLTPLTLTSGGVSWIDLEKLCHYLTTCAYTNPAVPLREIEALANIHGETHMTMFQKTRKNSDSHQQEKA